MGSIQQAMDSFLTSNRTVWSPRTTDTYASALRRFASYIKDSEHISLASPTPLLAKELDLPERYAEFLASQHTDVLPPGTEAAAVGLSESTYRVYLSALASFYSYLFMVDDLGQVTATEFQRLLTRLRRAATNPSLKSTTLRPETVRHAPDAALIDRIIRLAKTNYPSPDSQERDQQLGEMRRLRNVALLETLRSTGVRISEALGLDVGDLRPGDRTGIIQADVAKGDKSRPMFFDGRSWHALRVYRSQNSPQPSSPLFLRHDRGVGDGKLKRLSRAGAQAEIRRLRRLLVRNLRVELVQLLIPDCSDENVQHILVQLDEAARRDEWPVVILQAQRKSPELADEVAELRLQIHQAEELTAHSFRHYLATYLLGKTEDLAAVQRILGHADPRTTERYAEQSHARLREVHKQAMDPFVASEAL
ncbi:MAG: tyrosine-type recombinase/integrase [Chloroflexi bacterium]|nr:tyrosine-type recombinase/integrase [Chloroflexota bacterium]